MFTRKFALDAAERVASTFIQAAAAVIIANQAFDVEVLKVALIAGGLAVVKVVAASRIGDSSSAAAVPGA